MSALISLPQVLPGVHRVRSTLANGNVVERWYAWRGGGPTILRAEGKSDALLAREIARLTPAAIQAFEAERRPKGDHNFLYGLITRYLASTEFENDLAPRTKRDRRKYLDIARADLGRLELRALEARGARHMLIKWRDRFSQTPKTADELLGSLSIVLQWAANRGEIRDNPLRDFPRLYHSNRAEIIWTADDLAKLKPHCALELDHAVPLALLTGLRSGDLIKLSWASVGEHAIQWQTSKSRRRTTVTIPILDDLRALLAEIPRVASVTILNSARKRPWKENGLASAFGRAKTDAGIVGLRFHDLRGTAATNLLRAGLELGDVATILGWQKDKVERIASRYITGQQMGLAMIERINRNRAETETVNRAVNRTPG